MLKDKKLFENRLKVFFRICCDEEDYPMCESRYVSIKDFEEMTGVRWDFALEHYWGKCLEGEDVTKGVAE